MKKFRRGAVVVLLAVGLIISALPAAAEENGCSQAVRVIEKQQGKASRDMRKIQREIAALRADLDKPGLSEVLGGLGYIFGLFGVAAYVASRRKD